MNTTDLEQDLHSGMCVKCCGARMTTQKHGGMLQGERYWVNGGK